MKFIKENSLSLAVGSFILAAVCFYQISPFSFKQYQVICSNNYSKPDEFTKCMSPYTSQYGIDKGLMILFIVLGIIFGVTFLVRKFSRAH